MLWARILADATVVIHALFVAFVVLGLAAILAGAFFRWRWVRNIWFRGLHLAAILVVVAESIAGVPCPLTVWENALRRMAGQGGYTGDFLGYWAHQFIFFQGEPWMFTVVYVVFGLGVVAAFFLAPPLRPGRPGMVAGVPETAAAAAPK